MATEPESQIPPPERLEPRVFLGWDAPYPRLVARAIWDRFGGPAGGEIGDLLIVVPARRAGRLVLGALVDIAEQARTALEPPRFLTPTEAADELLGAPRTTAGGALQQLAWRAALLALPVGDREAIVASNPDPTLHTAWSRIGRLISHAHEALGARGYRFRDVADRASSIDGFQEIDRWRALADAQDEYAARLAELGRPDAALERLERAGLGATTTDAPVVLAGVADPPMILRQALAACAGPVTPFVYGPESRVGGFDALGALIDAEWGLPDLPDDLVRFALDADDQAEHAIGALAEWSKGRAAHDCVLVTPSAEVGRALSRRADRTPGLRVRDAAMRTVASSAPGRTLAAAASLLESRDDVSFARFVRVAPVTDAITRALGEDPSVWLDAIDKDHERHLPRFPSPNVRAVGAAQDMLGELWTIERAPAETMARAVRGVLLGLFGDMDLASPDPEARADARSAEALISSAEEIARAGGMVDLSPAEAVRLVLDDAGGRGLPGDAEPNAVELVGWLDAVYDPAPCAVVCGLNEGLVPADPSSLSGVGALLPEPVRRAMGLETRSRAVALDSYRLSALVGSREQCALISGRRTSEGEALLPSRLLLGSGPKLVKRVTRATAGRAEASPVSAESGPGPGAIDRFVPAPVVLEDTASLGEPPILSVTAFAMYLRSPYEFYLRYILRLRERSDTAVEMDGGLFGSVVHDALEQFGLSDADASDNEDTVRAAMLSFLHDAGKARFGDRPRPAVRLQLAAAQSRLVELARWHAERRRKGWLRFLRPEWKTPDGGIELAFDGRLARISGKIDRIERNAHTGAFAVLDYKTGEQQPKAGAALSGPRGEAPSWHDLQLPLYRRLLLTQSGVPADAEISVGYINVGRAASAVGLDDPEWTADEFASADRAAAAVIDGIRDGIFDELGEDPTRYGILGRLTGEAFEIPGEVAVEDAS